MIIHGISIKNQREREKARDIHLAVTSCIDCIIVTYVFTIRDSAPVPQHGERRSFVYWNKKDNIFRKKFIVIMHFLKAVWEADEKEFLMWSEVHYLGIPPLNSFKQIFVLGASPTTFDCTGCLYSCLSCFWLAIFDSLLYLCLRKAAYFRSFCRFEETGEASNIWVFWETLALEECHELATRKFSLAQRPFSQNINILAILYT